MQRSAELGKKKRKKLTAEQDMIMSARVVLDAGELKLAKAFRRLSSCRHELGQIPVTAIWQWQDRMGITSPSLRDFTEAVIVSLDVAELVRLTRKKPPKPPKPPTNRPQATRRRRSRHV